MDQQDSKFSIKPPNVSGALTAIKALATSGRSFAWVTTSDYVNAETLTQAMQAWCWALSVDLETGEVQSINFEGEKLGDEKMLLDAIAPFVEPGSFIEMQGEDGELWCWIFDGKACEEKAAIISWD